MLTPAPASILLFPEPVLPLLPPSSEPRPPLSSPHLPRVHQLTVVPPEWVEDEGERLMREAMVADRDSGPIWASSDGCLPVGSPPPSPPISPPSSRGLSPPPGMPLSSPSPSPPPAPPSPSEPFSEAERLRMRSGWAEEDRLARAQLSATTPAPTSTLQQASPFRAGSLSETKPSTRTGMLCLCLGRLKSSCRSAALSTVRCLRLRLRRYLRSRLGLP